jgi:hypothetical protein
MNLFRKLQRVLRLRRITQRLTVWTKDEFRRTFFYDIRIVPTRDPDRFLVRFDRTGINSGNTMRVHRILRRPAVHDLQMRAV